MTANNINIADALAWGRKQLGRDSQLDLDLLLAHCLQQPRSYLFAHDNAILDQACWQAYQQLVQRRRLGEPTAYLIGQQSFWAFTLQVDHNVLIPRPDTECLVETALSLLDADKPLTIIDMGTGSGAIGLALAYESPQWQVDASDCCAKALQVAQHNAQRLGLNVNFYQGDWFQALPSERRYDAIVSNPPYLHPNDPHLPSLRFEPKQALVAEQQGLAALEYLIMHAPTWLKPQGWLIVEHGYDQHQSCLQYLQQRGFVNIDQVTDLAGHVRVSFGQASENLSG